MASVRPWLMRDTLSRRNGVTSLPRMPACAASTRATSIQPSTSARGIAAASGGGWTTSTPCCRRSAPCISMMRRDVRRILGAMLQHQTASRGVERGELVRPEANHRNAEGFQSLQGPIEIENRLRPRAHHRDGGPGQAMNVGRHVEAVFTSSMNAPDSPGGHDRDRSGAGQGRRGGHGRGARAAGRDHGCDIANAYLGDGTGRGQLFDLVWSHPDDDTSAQQTDRRGNRSFRANGGLHRIRCLQVDRGWQAMREHRRLEGHDRPPRRQRCGHLDAHIQISFQAGSPVWWPHPTFGAVGGATSTMYRSPDG